MVSATARACSLFSCRSATRASSAAASVPCRTSRCTLEDRGPAAPRRRCSRRPAPGSARRAWRWAGTASSFSSSRRAPSWLGAVSTIPSSRSSARGRCRAVPRADRRVGTPAPASRSARRSRRGSRAALRGRSALPRRVEPLERAVGAQVGRIELQHLLVRLRARVGSASDASSSSAICASRSSRLARVERSQLACVQQPYAAPASAAPPCRGGPARGRRRRASARRPGSARRPSPPPARVPAASSSSSATTTRRSRRRLRSSVVPAAARSLSLSSPVTPAPAANPSSTSRLATSDGSISKQRQAGPVGLGRIGERPAVERPEPLQPIDPLAQRVGDREQHLVRVGQLGGVLGPLVERQRHARDSPRAPDDRLPPAARARRWPEPNRVGLSHLAVRGERRVDVLESRLLQVPDAEEQLLALLQILLRGVGRGSPSAGEIAAQRLDDAVPVLPRLEDAPPARGGPDRWSARRRGSPPRWRPRRPDRRRAPLRSARCAGAA